MASALQDIADTIATDFREAVMDAEKADIAAIETINKEFNIAYTEYFAKEAVLQSKREQALRTLQEIQDLADVNETTYKRRIEAIQEQINEYKETKTPRLDPAAQANQMGLKVVKT